jgi:transcriptional regulator with XRE-family HTH domain
MNREEDCQSECNKRIAEWLVQLRLDHGLSIKELSQLTHLSVYKLKKTENCQREIRTNEIFRLAKVYKRNGVEFITEFDNIYKGRISKGAI